MPSFTKFDRRTFATDIVGFSFSGYKWKKSDLGKSLELIAENENKYDPNAIRVHLDGKKIGYVAKESALEVRPMILNRAVKGWILERAFPNGFRVQVRMTRRLK